MFCLLFSKWANSRATASMLNNVFPCIVELTDPTSEVSRSWSAVYLLWYAYLSTLVVRCKYYHAWLLSEAICNNSGMGFNGYEADGTPKWDKMSNIDVFGFEVKNIDQLKKNSNTLIFLSWCKINYTHYIFSQPVCTSESN